MGEVGVVPTSIIEARSQNRYKSRLQDRQRTLVSIEPLHQLRNFFSLNSNILRRAGSNPPPSTHTPAANVDVSKRAAPYALLSS